MSYEGTKIGLIMVLMVFGAIEVLFSKTGIISGTGVIYFFRIEHMARELRE